MAIMAVKIDDTATLRMNEFFDFGGMCYAISRSRSCACAKAADLEDFYECTVLTDWIEDVPVVFLCSGPQDAGNSDVAGNVKNAGADRNNGNGRYAGNDRGGGHMRDAVGETEKSGMYICGWYRQAKIYRKVLHPSLFIEGNIEARALDAVLLAPEHRIPAKTVFSSAGDLFREKHYKVIEEDDSCHDRVQELVMRTDISAVPVRYALYDAKIDRVGLNMAGSKRMLPERSGNKHIMQEQAKDAALARYEFCISHCMEYAARLMGDGCEHIGEIKTLKEYARLAQVYGADNADGYYYEAMANEQLGFIRDGLKAVNKALALEPDGADLMAQKANLLVAYGNYEDALALYAESFDISGDESYLLMKGVVYFMIGNVDAAYKTYRQIGDKSLLADAGINLKDMEHKWPFVAIRGLKNLLKLK